MCIRSWWLIVRGILNIAVLSDIVSGCVQICFCDQTILVYVTNIFHIQQTVELFHVFISTTLQYYEQDKLSVSIKFKLIFSGFLARAIISGVISKFTSQQGSSFQSQSRGCEFKLVFLICFQMIIGLNGFFNFFFFENMLSLIFYCDQNECQQLFCLSD